MTIDDLGNIGELVSSIAVLVSLIYLAFEVRKNTETGKTSTYQAVVSNFAALNQSIAASAELASLFIRGQEDFKALSDVERARVSQLFFACFHYFENMFYQQRKGYLEQEVWVGWKRLMLAYHARPGFQQWWSLRSQVFSEPFVAFLASEPLDVAVASYYDVSHVGQAEATR